MSSFGRRLGTNGSMALQIRDRFAHEICVLLHAEPSTDLRPGSTIALRCEIHNRSQVTVCGALLRFILPADIVIARADQLGIVLAPIEPNAQTTITLDVAVHAAALDGAELAFCAALVPADGSLLRSNTVAVRISSRPRLAGPETYVNVSHSDVPGELRVEAQITNDGTACAKNITVDLPVPIGTQPVSVADLPTFWLDRLDAGQTRKIAYAVRVTAASARSIRATDASIRARDMRRIALPASRPLALSPGMAKPVITIVRDGQRFRIAIDVTNAGPGPACDVALDVRWPEAYGCSRFSLTSNGARVAPFERLDAWTRARVNDDGLNVLIAAIDATQTVAFGFDLYALPGASTGLLAVEMHVDGARISSETTLAWSPRQQIGLRLVYAPDEWVDTGTYAALIVELANHGDDDETVILDVSGAPACVNVDEIAVPPNAPIAIAAGTTKQVTVDVHLPIGLRDGERIALAVTAGAAHPAARIECTIVARDRVWIESRSCLDSTDGSGVIELMHRGTTPARNVALVCADGTRITLGDIEPGAVRRLPIPERHLARFEAGAELVIDGRPAIALEPFADRARATAGVDAVLRVPASAIPGSTLPVVCYIVCEQAIRLLRIRAQPLEGATEVAGSLLLDGTPVHRASGDEPVVCVSSPAGLILRDIAAGSQIDLMWSVRTDATACDPLRMRLELDADGRRKIAFARARAPAIPSVTQTPSAAGNALLQPPHSQTANALLVATPDPSRSPNVALSDGRGEPALAGVDTDAQSELAIVFVDLDPLLVDRCIELLRDCRKPLWLAHVALLRAVLPTADSRLDAPLNAALDRTRDALEQLFDRLAIVARMPDEPVRLWKRNDPGVRSALIALFEAIALAAPPARDIEAKEPTMPLLATIARDFVRRQHALLAGADSMSFDVISGTIGLLTADITRFPALDEALSCYAEALGRVEREAWPSAMNDDVHPPAIEMLEEQRRQVADTLAKIRLDLLTEKPMCMPADIPAIPSGVILNA